MHGIKMAARKTDENTSKPRQTAKGNSQAGTPRSSNGKSKTKQGIKSNDTKLSGLKKKEKEHDAIIDEVILVITLLVSLLLILSYINLCGAVGNFLNYVIFGFIGLLAYLFPFILFFEVAFGISNRGNRVAKRRLFASIGLVFVVASFIQLISGYDTKISIFGYFDTCGKAKNGGGFIGSILLKLLYKSFGSVATALILIALLVICFLLITGKTIFASLKKAGFESYRQRKEARREHAQMEYDEEDDGESEDEVYERRSAKIITLHKNSGEAEGDNKELKQEAEKLVKKEEPLSFIDALKSIGKKGKSGKKNQPEKENAGKDSIESKTSKDAADNIYDMADIPANKMADIPITGSYFSSENKPAEESIYEQELKRKFGDMHEITNHNNRKPEETDNFDFTVDTSGIWSKEVPDIVVTEHLKESGILSSEEFDLLPQEEVKPLPPEDVRPLHKEDRNITESEHLNSTDNIKKSKPAAEIASNSEMPDFIPMPEPIKEYVFPPIDLLGKPPAAAKGMTDRDLKETALKLQSTLESFGVRVTVVNVSCGPAVTRYELQPEQGVKVSRITGLSDDIKLNLAASDIRIEAPISGKAAVGIEVPNKEVSSVYFRDLIEHKDFITHPSDVAFAVGKDIGGQTVVADIAKMPHLLIAGATGSGKSVCINTLIMSILYKSKPSDVRLIMIDPKVVELSVYNGIPHLLIPVVTDPKKASAALNWAVMEMTDRYNKFADLSVRDLKGYNAKVAEIAELEDEKYQKLPQIVIIVDELADLMMVASNEVETAICRLAQMARAAGMHLIIATQRPSVNVITGVIKANVPSRIAFSVSSAIDSRTIIDGSGAESLLGKGDMLFFPSGIPKPVRVQGAFISDKEVSAVVDFLKEQNEGIGYNAQINEQITNSAASSESGAAVSGGNDRDDYFIEAGKFIIDKDKASIGMLQRIYKIGFNRAARIMDQLAEAGVVGPEEGTKPRKILMTMDEFEQYVDEYV